jgi:hypothetical protein
MYIEVIGFPRVLSYSGTHGKCGSIRMRSGLTLLASFLGHFSRRGDAPPLSVSLSSNHSQTLYPDLYAFKPERFLLDSEPNIDVRAPDFAFGYGRR